MKYALKEWSTTIEALGKGQIVAVWRKGSVQNKPGVKKPFESFNIEQNKVVLFPTFTHQNFDDIKKEFWALHDQNTGPNKDNQITIKYWAEVEEEIEVETIDQLLNASSELVNSDEHLVSSWNLYPDHKGKILFLRIYLLSDPILITNSDGYIGSKSWIELNINVPKIGSKAILSFKDFSEKIRLVKALLEQAPAPQTVVV